MRRNVKQDLADMAQERVSGIGMGRLAKMYSKKAAQRRARDRYNEGRFHEDPSIVDQLRLVLDREVERQASAPQGNLPVNSVFASLQIAKGSKQASHDAGLSSLIGMLEKKWRANRDADITASEYSQIREFYDRNYPRSAANQVINDIGQQGYVTLPLSEMMHIASQIRSQRDYDKVIKDYGLHTSQPHHVKARNFILSVVNRSK